MPMEAVNSLESQLKTVVDLCNRLIVSSPSSTYGSESMEQLVADQSHHFQVLIEGLRNGVFLREEKFKRALGKTMSEQSRLEKEIALIEKGIEGNKTFESKRNHSTVSDLVELREKLRAQMAELDSLRST